MTLVVFDRGTRIKTPASSIFPPRRVEPSEASAPEPAIPPGADSPQAEHEQLVEDYALLAESAEHKSAVQAYAQNRADSQSSGMLARQIMSAPVISCQLHTPLSEALTHMESAHIHYLAVFDEQDELTGVISQHTILMNRDSGTTRVEQLMQQQFMVAQSDTPVIEIASTLLEYQIGAVLVLDREDQLCGIITRTDLIRLLISRAGVEGWA